VALRTRYQAELSKWRRLTEEENKQVLAAGGLHVLGTERHEARRIDNQLRGRSGRQGDIGSSQFFLSLQDDLMRLFGGEMIASLMDKLRVEEDMPLEHGMLSGAIERAQKRVEGRNFDLRKHVLEYDDVLNKQREVIYRQRREALTGELAGVAEGMVDELVERAVDAYIPDKTYPEEWDVAGLKAALLEVVPLPNVDAESWRQFTKQGLAEELKELAHTALGTRAEQVGLDIWHDLKRVILLRMVDSKWMSHLDNMDELRQGIGLRAYGQKDPLVEYKLEAFDMFTQMIEEIKADVVRYLFRVQVVSEPRTAQGGRGPALPPARPVARPKGGGTASSTLGRNDPCPCKSGKKYKKCCGREA